MLLALNKAYNGIKNKDISGPHYIILFSCFAALILCFAISIIFFPHFFYPDRYLRKVLPIIMILYTYPMLLVFFNIYLNKLSPKLITLFIMLFCVAFNLANNTLNEKILFADVDMREHSKVYEFIDTMPKDAVFAGWPGAYEIVNNIELINKRRVFYSWESHQVEHKGFVLNMRETVDKLFDAYLATSIAELKKFRDENGVRYMIVDMAHFEDKDPLKYVKPKYFKPFDRYLDEKLEAARRGNKKFILPKLQGTAIYQDDDIFIVDLSKL
jgi:hypothetical protein